jgi:FecR protein
VGKNSKVEIGKTKKESSFFRQITGIVYYAMNSIKGNRRPVEVRTATATIGIRGTRFIVTDVEGRNEVGMRKGLVSVTSPEGEFEIHKQAELDEFEAFKKAGEAEIAKSEREFEEYKANTQQEFIEYKREFSLGADRMASFNGKRVEDRPLSGETKQDMESIESYAEQWIKEVRD